MALAIRLSRGGRKGRPFYRIVVADKRMPRDGRFIEKLGTYNPLLANDDEKRISFNEERVKYWLGEGAKPSERVAKFLGTAGLIEMPTPNERPQKSAPSEKTMERRREKEEKKKEAEEAAAAAAAEAAEAEANAAEEAAAAEAAPEEAPAEEAPAEAEATEAAAEEAPSEEAPAEEAPAEEAAADEEKKDA